MFRISEKFVLLKSSVPLLIESLELISNKSDVYIKEDQQMPFETQKFNKRLQIKIVLTS